MITPRYLWHEVMREVMPRLLLTFALTALFVSALAYFQSSTPPVPPPGETRIAILKTGAAMK